MNAHGKTTNGGGRIEPCDPFALGVWVLAALNGTHCLARVEGSEGREDAVAQSMLDDVRENQSVLVDLKRKYMLKEIVYPDPFVDGVMTTTFRPGSLPSCCRHENTLELTHEFVSHAALTTITFMHEQPSENIEMFRESMRSADASAETASKVTPPAPAPLVVDLQFTRGVWILVALDGTGADCLALVEGSEGREEVVRGEILKELRERRKIYVDLVHKHVLKEIVFPKPVVVGMSSDGTPKLDRRTPYSPMSLPSARRHENTLDLVHPFVSHAQLTSVTFLDEFHPEDVERLKAAVGVSDDLGVLARMTRSNLVAPQGPMLRLVKLQSRS
jgi:hypothetical protein